MKRSPETCANISKANKGRVHTPESRANMSAGHVGRKRRPHSEEAKRKMSIAMKGKKKSTEHRKNLSVAKLANPSRHWLGKKRPEMTGENNWKWIADRTKLAKQEERFGNRHKEWSRNVKNRDGWKCRIANSDCSGRLESHHILGWKEHPKLRYQVNNGITLCHAHHPRVRAEEKRLAPYFTELVSVSKGNFGIIQQSK